MRPLQRIECTKLDLIARVLVLLALALPGREFAAQQATGPVPEVTGAAAPFYPPIALAARVEGTVQLHIATDGKRAISITPLAGPAMLIKPTEENVQTWVFAELAPSSFDVTFRYKILDTAGCEMRIPPVILHLPAEVEVDGKLNTCDTDRYFRQQKYLREQHVYAVELHLTMDGEAIANPPEVTISNGSQTLTLPVRNSLILVPKAMASGPRLSLSAVVGTDAIAIPGIEPDTLKCVWNIGLANKESDNDDLALKGKPVRSMCTVSFDPLDGDGMGMVVSQCRKPLKK